MQHISDLLAYCPPESLAKRKGYHWFVVSTVCIGAFMAALDASIINLALPSLVREFHITIADAEWISLVYLLTLASLVITFGRIADMFGRRLMYTAGFLVFVISSLFCGLSSNLVLLLISRVFQAVGAAMLQANSVSIITACTPAGQRGRAIGIQAGAQGIGLSLGPVIGGALLSMGDWRWLFYVNIPIGIAGTVLAFFILPQDRQGKRREPFDFWGFLFLTPAIVLIVYVLNRGQLEGWSSPAVALSLFAAILAFTAFMREERRSASPILDFTLFKNRVFVIGNLTGFLSFTVMYGILLLSPFMMEGEFRLSIVTAGVYLALVPVGMTVFTPVSGYLSDRFGMRLPALAGLGAVTAGCGLLALIRDTKDLGLLLGGLLLLGIGMGIFTPPNNSNLMGSVPSERLGVAGATLNMSRTLGMGMGVTISGALFQLSLHALPVSAGGSHLAAYRMTFLIIGFIGAAALLITALRKRTSHRYTEAFIEYYI